MGLMYSTMLIDERNWNYLDKDRIDYIRGIVYQLKSHNSIIHLQAEWHQHIVIDLEKMNPTLGPIKDIILDNCDYAFYWNDSSPYKIKKIPQ